MADPHHVEALTSFDRWTVGLYRAGLIAAAIGVGGLAFCTATDRDPEPMRWVTFLGVALVVANLHLYDPHIKWFVSVCGWVSAVALAAAQSWVPLDYGPLLEDVALGFGFVVLSAVALKERYCFRLPIVVAVPPVLALSLVPLRLGAAFPAAGLLGAGAAVLGVLAISKLTMPLHYDIGDKSKYQV